MKIFTVLKWICILLLCLSAGLGFLLATERGFRLLVSSADSLAGPAFSVAGVEGKGIGRWRLTDVRLSLDGIVDLSLAELRCSWRPVALIDKELRIDRLSLTGMVLRLPDTADEENDDTAVILPAIQLPLDLRLDALRLHDAAIYYSDTEDPFRLDELRLKVSGQGDKLAIVQLQLAAPDFGGELQGSVQFLDNWPLTVQGEWWLADPGIGDLSGLLDAAGDLETLAVSIGVTTPAVAEVEGELTGILSDLHWRATGKTEYFSLADIQVDQPVAGTLTVVQASGTLDTYEGTLAANIEYQGYPQLRAEAEVKGDYDGLGVAFLSFFLDDAELTTRGEMNWADGFSWQAEVAGRQLDPGRFIPGWPGAVDALLQSRGKWTAEGLAANLNIESLQGELRGFPVQGSGRAGLENDTLHIDALQLQSGSSSFRAHGVAGRELDLFFQAASADLASMVPQGSGEFEMQGTVSGSRDQPGLAMTAQGVALRAAGVTVQNLKVVLAADLGEGGVIDADIAVDGVEVGGESISQGRLLVKGTLEDHQLSLSLAGSPGGLDVVASGGLLEQQWQGKVSRMVLDSDSYGAWTIPRPFSLLLAGEEVSVSAVTLVQETSRLSLAGQWQEGSGWQLQGGADNFSLHLLETWGLLPQKLDGILTASLTAAGRGAMPQQAEIRVAVPEVSLAVEHEDGEAELLQWKDNSLTVDLTDGTAMVTARSMFQDGSTADLTFTAAGCCAAARLDEMELTGKLDVRLADISPLAPLSNYMLTGKGQVRGDFSLQGTVARPVLRGGMTMTEGEIILPDAGIGLQEVELSLAGDAAATRVTLTLVSEGSRLRAEGTVSQDRQQQWQADFTIEGKDFQAVHLSEYQATVSPDLRLVYGRTGTAVSGTVMVSRALLAPLGFSGSVSSSRDVVVVDADGAVKGSGLPLSLDVDLVLGEAVRVDAFGVKGLLDGRLKIQQEPGQVMTGLGSLKLREGTFVFKGAELNIDRGLVYYQGGPIDDPGLDVRAKKEVDDTEVGVQLTGTVAQMEMNLFSSPKMDESDIVAYLLTGRDMSASSSGEGSMLGAAAGLGIGRGGDFLKDITGESGFDVSLASGEEASDVSLVVGREIYKGLYISYGKGLTDAAGTFKARYKLKYGFSVETETTSEATGTDLFWSMER